MTTRIHTETGSCYEIDAVAKQIRRLNGKNDPTPRMAVDGQWRAYRDLLPDPIVVGKSMIVVYGSDVELLPETREELQESGGFGVPTTMTSRVVEIEEDK